MLQKKEGCLATTCAATCGCYVIMRNCAACFEQIIATRSLS